MLTDNAKAILEKRYFCRDADGKVQENWEGLCRRVAHNVALAEESSKDQQSWEEAFFGMVHELIFLPNSPTLFNAGMSLGNLSACFVLPVGDSLGEIFDAVKNAALIFATGGGCGYDFSQLRKKGSPVSRTSGVSSGPISFIEVFNSATEVIKQGGKRRGANMGVLRIDHPDIEQFLDAKTTEGKLSNFNLSVAVTDRFIQTVKAGRQEDILTGDEFDLYDAYLDKVDRTVSATALFDQLVERAWANGEPGVVFIDTVNRRHPLRALGEISGVNPCGEQPLLPNESCNLGAINLAKFYSENPENSDGGVAWEKLTHCVYNAVRFLDDVIEVNKFPIKAIEEASLRSRKIGLGIMGWADLLLKIGMPYNCDEALALAERMMEFIQYHALRASCLLAKERGTFPAYEQLDRPERPSSVWSRQGLDWEVLDKWIKDNGLRNGCLTTIAPTGSLSLIAGVSSGIEPNFQWKYKYHRVEQEFTEIHSLARPYLESDSPLPSYFVTALEVTPEWHVRMQATFQRWVDSGISKTINLPREASKEEVAEAILLAWQLGCKGVTLYRSGSRAQEVLVVESEVVEQTEELPSVGLSPRRRPRKTTGETLRIPVGDNCGHLFVTVNHDDLGPCESFIGLGRGGGCISSHTEALGRLVSLALRSGIDYAQIIDQLAGIRCSKSQFVVRSCADAVAHALRELIIGDEAAPGGNAQLGDQIPGDSAVAFGENPECPDCYNTLYRQGGCIYCRACGYTKCV